MVDDSNILGFEGGGNSTSEVKYSVEWWIFKPEKNGQQVIYYISFLDLRFSMKS
jgi:hypothetical protein